MTVSLDAVLKVAVPLIKKWEGFRASPYLCSAGVPTIGYGSTFYEDGTKVTLRDATITQAKAEALLGFSIKTIFLPGVLNLCPTLDTANRIAAILSWTYNLGTANLRNSTMRQKILAQDWAAVPDEIKKWNLASGKVTQGLISRRADEATVFMS